MKFTRLFSHPKTPVSKQVEWEIGNSLITASDGTIIFEMEDIEFPKGWSQNAVDILAQKYFRKAGVPKETDCYLPNQDVSIPLWLQPSKPYINTEFSCETSAKQVFHRLAGAWTYWGWKEGIFKQEYHDLEDSSEQSSEESAKIFYDEIYLMLAWQIAAPNSPQWFNTGLHWAYGIEGSASGQWTVDLPKVIIYDSNHQTIFPQAQVYETFSAYERPQPHACFIQPISDDLVNPGGIMDLWTREVRLFKQGSGTGSNFSNLRAKNEHLSGGGKSSGLMSFLEIGDTTAKSIKSGGTTRRAAKMVVLDPDHPEILEFINWKSREEYKAACMNIGSRILAETPIMIGSDEWQLVPQAIKDRLKNGNFSPETFGITWQGEAVTSVSGQNSNNSIRITDKLLEAIQNDQPWELKGRIDNSVNKVIPARDLWFQLCRAAWASGDPGVQFEDEINLWHTCKADGRILASNPCSEYLFLDNTACNLASLNLVKFLKPKSEINTTALLHATRLWTTVLEISVFMAAFPSKEIALGSYNYRTLGLGFSNLGGLLMRVGLPYDSDQGRNLASALTAIIHGQAYLTSIEMGKELEPFPRWKENRDSLYEVLQMHCNAALDKFRDRYKDPNYLEAKILDIYYSIQDEIDRNNFPRNAQVTNIAPTGTISFVMDCDTTGVEPSISLISFKSLAGGGDLILKNEAVEEALTTLGYSKNAILEILNHISEKGTIEGTLHIREQDLPIFDCANPGNGKRFIPWEAHLKMVAAVQPFISGGISKTINLPNSATIEDVSNAYLMARKLKVKSVAIYRDGSKLDQPLKSKQTSQSIISQSLSDPDPLPSDTTVLRWKNGEAKSNGSSHPTTPGLSRGEELTNLNRGERNPIPYSHPGYHQKVRIDGHTLYLIEGNYPDGSLGEIFLELSKEGSTTRALLNSLAKSVSIGLQFGVPLDRYIRSFVYTRFEPSGLVEGHNHIKIASSILDYVFRHLAIKYLNQHEFADNKEDLNPPSYMISTQAQNLQMTIGSTNTNIVSSNVIITSPSPDPVKITSTLEECPNCHSLKLIRTGTCTFCTNCKEHSGCG